MVDSQKGGKKVFIICPVRGAAQKDSLFLETYVSMLEELGAEVHYPPRDTEQYDPRGLGYNICHENRDAMREADEVHVYWTKESEGSRFDLGMALMREKPVFLINKWDVERTPYKSIQNVLLGLDKKYSKLIK